MDINFASTWAAFKTEIRNYRPQNNKPDMPKDISGFVMLDSFETSPKLKFVTLLNIAIYLLHRIAVPLPLSFPRDNGPCPFCLT